MSSWVLTRTWEWTTEDNRECIEWFGAVRLNTETKYKLFCLFKDKTLKAIWSLPAKGILGGKPYWRRENKDNRCCKRTSKVSKL